MAAETKVGIILEAEDRASRTIKEVTSSIDTMRGSFDKQVTASKEFAKGIALAGTALGGLLGYGIKIASDLETAKIGLTTLLGSADAAGKTVERIKKEAARTPFELVGLTQAVQLMSSVTHNGDKAIDVILNIGEGLAAMGKGQAELDRITVNLQQVAALGKAQMVDIKQFAYAGIPIFEMLSEQTGLAGDALAGFIENGGVTFDMLSTMFDKANDSGGRFFNAYVNQSGSFTQSLSNLKDSFGIFLATTVQTTGVFAGLNTAMQKATKFMDVHKESIADAVKWLKEHKDVVYIAAGAIAGALTPAVLDLVFAFGALMIELAPFIIAGGAIVMLIEGVKEGSIWMTALAAGILTVFIPAIVSLATTIFTSVIPAIVSMAVAFWPFLLAGVIIAGVVAGIMWIVQNWDMLSAKALEIWGKITATVGEYVQKIKDVISGFLDGVKAAWEFTLNFLYEFAANLLGLIFGSWITILDTFLPGWQDGLLAIGDAVANVFGGIKDTTVSTWTATVDWLATKELEMYNTSVPILTKIGDFWNKVWGGVRDFFMACFTSIKDSLTSTFDYITQKIDAITQKISALIQPIADLGAKAKAAFDSVGSSISGGFNSVINTGRSAIKLAEGGIVTRPTFAMIGEGGEPEAVIPLSKMSGIGGGITVNILGGSFLSEDAGRMLGNQIIEELRRNMRI